MSQANVDTSSKTLGQTPRKKAQQGLLVKLSGLAVIILAIAAAFMFGETSPVIVSGTLTLTPELREQAKGMKRVFIILRDPSSPMPMPWGAFETSLSKEPDGEFLDFILTRDNTRLMGGMNAELPKTLTIKARLDMDGFAGADTPGDIVGSIEGITVGSRDVKIVLDKLMSEPMSEPTSESQIPVPTE